MYYRPQLQPKKPARRTAQVQKFPAATAGWIANQNLSSPTTGQGAELLDNWFPTATGQEIRRGIQIYATLGLGDSDVTAIFDYNNGNIKRLFASTATTIYDITNIISPINYRLSTGTDEIVDDLGNYIGQQSTVGMEVAENQNGGDWIVTQFATTGGTYLVAVNGEDPMQIFDGEYWFPIDEDDVYTLAYDALTSDFTENTTITGGTSGATAYVLHVEKSVTSGTLYLTDITGTFQDNEIISGGGGSATVNGVVAPYYVGITGVDTSLFSYVWSYKNRLYFIEKESTNVWYLPVDSIGGAATVFPMVGEFSEGGQLFIGSSWSQGTSGDGGLSEQCVFITDEGQVAVYQGLSPEPDQGWSRVGGYQIGKPLGRRAHIRAGGDLIVATDIGNVPLSQAVSVDVTALAAASVSYPIDSEWKQLVFDRRQNPWECAIWPERQMVFVSPKSVEDETPLTLIANATTGAWTRFTGWRITCLCAYDGRMFFGSSEGRVYEAYVTGTDDGSPFTATYVPMFIDMGSPSSMKVAKTGRAVLRGTQSVNDQVTAMRDYVIRLLSPPPAAIINDAAVWDAAIWGTSTWGGAADKMVQQNWRSVAALGYTLAPCLQLTSGSLSPLDTELISLDLTYTVGEVGS